jgi:dsDNA-binding SOS-regulon protein
MVNNKFCICYEKEYKMLFKKKNEKLSYDKSNKKPIIRASICTGEQVAGFKNLTTGEFEEVMLLTDKKDLDKFKEIYSITEDIEKIY